MLRFAALLVGGLIEAADVTTLPPDPERTEFVRRMVKTAGLDLTIRVVTDPETKNCAYATTTARGEHYIAVRPDCGGPPVVDGRFDPFAVALLGHEIGHIALKHRAWSGTDAAAQKREQLEADEFSGRMVAMMGGRLQDALALAVATPETASGPNDRNRRESVDAAAKGWHSVRGQTAGMSAQSWGSDGGPFSIHWQSFWMGFAAALVLMAMFRR